MSAQFYDLKFPTNTNKDFDFSQLKDKVVLIVNTASQCGFTPQYAGLQSLNDKYKDQGLVILGFPSNQFGAQEPGTDEQIAEFCQINHGVTFQLMKKSDVNGDDTNPVFKFLKDQKSQYGLTRIKWNFEKFLIDRNGQVVSRYNSMSSPGSMEKEIERLLAEQPAVKSEL